MDSASASAKTSRHHWRFFRAGGFDQVRLDSGADLLNLDKLDQKLWVALACPTSGLDFDSRTLSLIDTDKDGRVRVPELIAATRWACLCLKNPSDLLAGSPALNLASINDTLPEGKQLLASARQILSNLGKKDAATISVEETTDTVKIFAQTTFNGDGIIPVEAAQDPSVKGVIADILATHGSEVDRSGKPGVSQAKVDAFFADAQAFSDWQAKNEADATIRPAGDGTAAAAAAVAALRGKINDYFTRCRLAAFDPRAINALNREEKEYLAFTAKDLTSTSAEIAALPLARVEAGKALPLSAGLNPAWSAAVSALVTTAITPLIGARGELTEADWGVLQGKLAPYEAWSAAKAGASVEKLGLARVREILAGKSREAITGLIAQDKALEAEAGAIAAVEKLVRLNRDLSRLLHNFVSFRDFYGRKEKAIFQAGTLYLDQRSCDLCLAVEDAGRHASMAGLAGTYLAYCDCIRKATGEKRQIVAAFTGGDSENLMVGRNGVFYDRKGQDWDATITKIIDNPISIRQAFFSPYKKLVRMIEEQVAKRAAAADASVDAKLAEAAKATAEADKSKPAAPAAAPAPAKNIDAGTLAALGLIMSSLLGALGTVMVFVLGRPLWQIPLLLLAMALAISTPSVIMAYLKLRKRNLGPILDANGWAVNAKAKINVPFGGSLTQIATLPEGAERDLVDPFAEKQSPWPKAIVTAIVLLVIYGALREGGFFKLFESKPAPAQAVEVPAGKAPTPASPAEPAK